MSRKFIGIWVLLICMICRAAVAQQDAFRITFTDKNNTPYSLGSPLAYLSARSLARRATQGIALDSTDLPVNPAYVDSVINLTGGLFYETSRWLNTCVILLQETDSAQILNLAGKPYISAVREVGSYCDNLYGRGVGNNTGSAVNALPQRTTGVDGDYYNYTWSQTQLVNGNYLHDQGYNGAGKLIAVLDAGFVGTDTHPWFDSMWTSGRMVDTFDFTFHNTNVFTQHVHGTMVLSTMAGYAPDSFVGTAPLAMYALYLTENNADDQAVNMDNMIAGAERADSLGADVITESLGYDLLASSCTGQTYPETFDSLDGKTTVAAKAANIATKKGMLFVATAGNDGSPPIPGWGNHVMTPGDPDSALTVGAFDEQSEAMASFSGYGPNAAGVVKPDVCAEGANAVVFNPYYPQTPTPFTSGSGTSFATPQIAGWAACLWEANPGATPAQIRLAIEECASSYSSPGDQLGYGVANFECAQIVLGVKGPVRFSKADWVIANPNPVINNSLHLSVSPNASQYVNFRLTDMTGNEVFSFTQYMYQGYNTPLDLAVPALAPGVYILRALSATQQQVIKVEQR